MRHIGSSSALAIDQLTATVVGGVPFDINLFPFVFLVKSMLSAGHAMAMPVRWQECTCSGY